VGGIGHIGLYLLKEKISGGVIMAGYFDESFVTIILLSLVEIYGDFALRFYALTNKASYLMHGLVGYAGVVYFLIQSLRLDNVLYVNGMWDGVSGILNSVAAYVILGDRLKNWSQYLGLGLIIAGIGLMKNHTSS
jgi:multidrug transporter EmrE-like cation transporter